jgi:HSP20 family protein
MTIVKWDPFRNVTTLQDRINKLFDDSFPRQEPQDDDLTFCDWRPSVDIYVTDNNAVIQVDLPGVKKENVSVEIKETILTIKGERMEDGSTPKENYLRKERCYGHFQRAFNLQYIVSPDKIKARFNDGVLTVEIPKPENEVVKKITVKID